MAVVSRGFQLRSMGRARAFYNADRGVGCEREGAGPQGNLILGAFLKLIFLLWKLQRKKHDQTGCWQCTGKAVIFYAGMRWEAESLESPGDQRFLYEPKRT